MIQELRAGDRQIPASGWNEMRAAVQGITPGQQQYNSSQRNPVYITVKNVTGSDLPAFSVVKLSGATYTRTGDTFINQAISNGVELDGNTPAAATDTIAITQAACPAGEFVKAIVSGATPCIVHKASNTSYQYAKPVTSQTGYLEGTDDVTNYRVLWIASGTGNKEAFIICDASGTPEQEYFIINWRNDGTGTPANDYSVYTKGSLHYIEYDSVYHFWKPLQANEGTPATAPQARPAGSKLVVCQVDAPSGAAEFRMPYFTPESNMGIPPKISTYNIGNAGNRCGVLMGEHEFSNGSFDYLVTGVDGSAGTATQGAGLTFIYQPNFIERVEVNGTTGGNNDVYADVFGESWIVTFPVSNISTIDYPDIYPYDVITVTVDFENQQCHALDYSKDYPNGTEMPFWYAPGRGWDTVTTPQGLSDLGLTLYQKNKTNAIL